MLHCIANPRPHILEVYRMVALKVQLECMQVGITAEQHVVDETSKLFIIPVFIFTVVDNMDPSDSIAAPLAWISIPTNLPCKHSTINTCSSDSQGNNNSSDSSMLSLHQAGPLHKGLNFGTTSYYCSIIITKLGVSGSEHFPAPK